MTDKHPVITHLTSPAKFSTQTRLAVAAGVKPHTISGKSASPNPLTLSQMTRILDAAPAMGVEITPDDFFPGFSDRAA
jgi:hypothetical protein